MAASFHLLRLNAIGNDSEAGMFRVHIDASRVRFDVETECMAGYDVVDYLVKMIGRAVMEMRILDVKREKGDWDVTAGGRGDLQGMREGEQEKEEDWFGEHGG